MGWVLCRNVAGVSATLQCDVSTSSQQRGKQKYYVTASTGGEVSVNHLLAPATQRRDTVYWKRGITYLRDLERRKTYALSCPGLRL
jgi:hypothetical protein